MKGFADASATRLRFTRRKVVARAVGWAVSLAILPGCSVCQQARRTMLEEPSAYAWKLDRARSLNAYRTWADEAWALECGCGEAVYPEEHALGFRDGFVDYVYAGGDGEPPPMPPRKFWHVAARGAPGQAAASEWFAGYRHGTQSARDGGYRERGVVASSQGAPESWQWDEGEVASPPVVEELGPTREELDSPAEALPAPVEAARGGARDSTSAVARFRRAAANVSNKKSSAAP